MFIKKINMENKIVKGELTVSRFKVPYAVFGNGAKMLLCINGAQQSIASWFSIARYFSGRGGFTLVCFDFPGQGRAEINSGSEEVTVEEQLEVINAIANRFSPSVPFYMISASWGNVISSIYASRFSDRVSRLLLGSFRMKPNALLMDTVNKGKYYVANEMFHELAEMFVKVFGGKLSEEKKNMIRQQFISLPPSHFRQLYNQANVFQNHTSLTEIVELNNISARTIVINGSEDPIIDGDDAEMASTVIPNCDYVLIQGAGHFLHFENTELISLYYDFFTGKHSENKFYLQYILQEAI